jgi:hypothetical protein
MFSSPLENNFVYQMSDNWDYRGKGGKGGKGRKGGKGKKGGKGTKGQQEEVPPHIKEARLAIAEYDAERARNRRKALQVNPPHLPSRCL